MKDRKPGKEGEKKKEREGETDFLLLFISFSFPVSFPPGFLIKSFQLSGMDEDYR
ncbi:MAG: hypothetical protein JXD23_07815 [Spirochaetales bacterium]|nr:hypothetical protein [Spirochaetales bacterium]